MKNLSMENIIKATGGHFFGGSELLGFEIEAITTDSREATPGCLFGAIPGERTDGHRYLASAAENGAVCALVEREIIDPPLPLILTPSTQNALGKIAGLYRSQFDIPFIGITGSVGKTSAKEMIASVLRQGRNILWTEGNLNNELGVPLTLFRLTQEHRGAVIEMGISNFGEMRRLTEIVRPDYAFITAIEDAHIEFFGDRSGVLRAKTEILDGVPENGVLFVNGDSPLLWDLECDVRKISYGLDPRCDVWAEGIKFLGSEGTGFTLRWEEGAGSLELKVPAYGKHVVYAALAACSLALEMGIDEDTIRAGLSGYATEEHRARLLDTGNFTIIDDCYNANPGSMEMAISSMDTLPGRRVCILGDMFELGADSERLHRQVGEFAVQHGAGLIIACGELAKYICLGARDCGGEAMYFPLKKELITALPGIVRPGDNVLVKASRGAKFEELAQALLEL